MFENNSLMPHTHDMTMPFVSEFNTITGNVNSIFCDVTTDYEMINTNRFPNLTSLTFDCDGDNPEVVCFCCDGC